MMLGENAMRRDHKFASKEMIIADRFAFECSEADAKMNNLMSLASSHFKFTSSFHPENFYFTLLARSYGAENIFNCNMRENTLLTLIVVTASCRMKKFPRFVVAKQRENFLLSPTSSQSPACGEKKFFLSSLGFGAEKFPRSCQKDFHSFMTFLFDLGNKSKKADGGCLSFALCLPLC
jgi:hypothetical protein